MVKAEWVQGDWEKLQRVNAPDDAYHVVSGKFRSFDQVALFRSSVESFVEAYLKPSVLISTLTVHLKPRSTFMMVLPDTSQSGKLFPIRKTFLPCLSNKSIISGIHLTRIILCTTY